jgi:YVTN family beta-propeller protein
MEIMKMNKLFKNMMMGICAVILFTSTLLLGVQNGINTPIIERNNDNEGNTIKGSQHPIVQIAEATKEIPNEGNYEGYIQENSYSKEKEQEQQPQLQYNSIERASEYGKVNEVTIKAEKLPNGQYAYRMIEHISIDGESKEDLTKRYPQIPTIPGPSIEINQNELLIIHSIDENGEQKTQRIEPKEIGSFEYFGDRFRTLGLFGAIIVNPIEKVPAQLDGKIVSVDVNTLDKQYVLFMVGSTFWGQEIDANHNQRPLWTNPKLGADLNQLIRFHILGAAHQHTFHLHAHRWLDPGTTNIIDTKLIQPNSPHWFIVEAGDRVGTGDWQYHCHVFAHMEAGMMGTFTVGKIGSNTKSIAGPGPSVSGGSQEKEGQGNFITFDISDEPGKWFRNVGGEVAEHATESLGIVERGGTAHFIMSSTNTVHTITSLLWPTGAPNMPLDEITSYRGGAIVQLEKPGLYVFTCKIHPYMFGGMIVDDPKTNGFDLGEKLRLSTGTELDPINEEGKVNENAIGTALALLKTFFVANNPSNWIDYTKPTWNPKFPNVTINFGGIEGNLQDLLLDTVGGSDTIDLKELRGTELEIPNEKGIGEVWIDTQFEKTAQKTKSGTATRINVEDWNVERKVALPEINMNNPHNMWSDAKQRIIYQTQWFDNMLTAFDRQTGQLLDNIRVGDAPSHVMTNPNNDLLYVALSGEQGVAELKFNKENNKFEMLRIIPLQQSGQNPTHPHAHWISSDGNKMITPNHFTDDATIIDFKAHTEKKQEIQSRTQTGKMSIATGMSPDGQTAYVANFLSSTISVIDMATGKITDTIDLADKGHALPIQTPVSPNGAYVITANTLTGNLAVIDTKTNEIVKSLQCDPGCHGVNFGAKEGGGYYAYVTSKFSNRMIVVDGDPNNDGNPVDAKIAGSILLTGKYDNMDMPLFETDDKITKYHGMGGQGVYAVPNVYPGWVEQLDLTWDLTPEQRDPINSLNNNQQLEERQQQLEQQSLKQQEIQELQQHQYQQQQQQESVPPMESNNNEMIASTPNYDPNMYSIEHPQQQKVETPENFAEKIDELRQQSLNQEISPDSQLNKDVEDSLNSFNAQQQQPPPQQETKTSQSIEEKLAQIQQQSINKEIVPELIEKKVKPPLEKVGNIISMLPVPYP